MTPARLLAPAALVAAAIALFAVVTSGSDKTTDKPTGSSATATPAAHRTRKPKPDATTTPSGDTYTVKPGDTPSGIADKENVDLDALLEANPDIDPAALTVGDELKLP
ncbi:MAG: LysM domain [Solirubrobacteraceae bacterium]|nr:LysM domain [Solirubrobacteraceae bacterium]